MDKKPPERRKKFLSFFIIFFTFSLSPYGKKQNHLLFPPFLSLEIEKPQGKTWHKKFFSFFFYLTFLDPTAPRNQKYYHLPLFRNFELKCPKTPLSALKFHFLQITIFSAVITLTHHLPTHTPFFRPIMSKKRALRLFLKITFFCSLLLLLNPETLSNHFFRQFNHQKKIKKFPKGEKKIFFFFIIYFTFSKKQNHLLFPPFFITGNRKTARENVLLKKIFFFIFDFFPPYRSS